MYGSSDRQVAGLRAQDGAPPGRPRARAPRSPTPYGPAIPNPATKAAAAASQGDEAAVTPGDRDCGSADVPRGRRRREGRAGPDHRREHGQHQRQPGRDRAGSAQGSAGCRAGGRSVAGHEHEQGHDNTARNGPQITMGARAVIGASCSATSRRRGDSCAEPGQEQRYPAIRSARTRWPGRCRPSRLGCGRGRRGLFVGRCLVPSTWPPVGLGQCRGDLNASRIMIIGTIQVRSHHCNGCHSRRATATRVRQQPSNWGSRDTTADRRDLLEHLGFASLG